MYMLSAKESIAEDTTDRTYQPPTYMPETDSCSEEGIILDSEGHEVINSSDNEEGVSIIQEIIQL